MDLGERVSRAAGDRGVAPFLRYLPGALYLDTAGSLLAVGLMHASYKPAGSSAPSTAAGSQLPALGVLAVMMAASRHRP
jgi:uncharacterized protein